MLRATPETAGPCCLYADAATRRTLGAEFAEPPVAFHSSPQIERDPSRLHIADRVLNGLLCKQASAWITERKQLFFIRKTGAARYAYFVYPANWQEE